MIALEASASYLCRGDTGPAWTFNGLALAIYNEPDSVVFKLNASVVLVD